jgi:hypothetical protein
VDDGGDVQTPAMVPVIAEGASPGRRPIVRSTVDYQVGATSPVKMSGIPSQLGEVIRLVELQARLVTDPEHAHRALCLHAANHRITTHTCDIGDSVAHAESYVLWSLLTRDWQAVWLACGR